MTAVKAGYITVQKLNTHRAKIKELAGYSTFSDNSSRTIVPSDKGVPDLKGTVLTLGVVSGGGDADLGVDKTLAGELDAEIEVLADALGVADV